MQQRFDGPEPRAEIQLDGKRVMRSHVANDWGLRLQWQIKRDGQVVATPLARVDLAYEHSDETPGVYEVVLQMWKYVDYRKNPQGEFVNSRFIDISNVVSYTLGAS